MLKKCYKCKIEKEETDFHRNCCNKDGLQKHCKVCQLSIKTKARQKKKEIRLERIKNYLESLNKEKNS